MNILHLTYSLSPGGRRNAIVALSNGLKQFSITNYAASLTNDEKNIILKNEDITIFQDILFLDKQNSYLLKSKNVANKLYDFCNKYNISIIHTHDAASQIIVSIMKRQYKQHLPHVHTFHRSLEMDTVGLKNKIRNLYANVYTDIITVGSTDRKNHYTKNNYFVSKKVVIIPFGIDVDKFRHKEEDNFKLRNKYNIQQDTIVLGAVGHFRKEKGLDNILYAYSHYLNNNSKQNTTLVILGTGSEDEVIYLHALSKKLGIYEHIHFVGHDKDIAKWYSLFDIYLHAARKEAFGLVLIEAMAVGLPIIAASVGGIPDIVIHGKTGFIAEPGNHIQFSQHIAQLSNNEKIRLKFGKYANKVALEKYSTTEYANNYMTIYKNLNNS